MIKVIIDGDSCEQDFAAIRTIGELIEVVQSTIDPTTIITGIRLNEQLLSEEDWRTPLGAQGESEFQFETGSREQYLQERLEQAPDFADHILKQFSVVAQEFEKGAPQDGNKTLSGAVDDLQAFLEWYASLLQVAPEEGKIREEAFNGHVTAIKTTCENLVQQHLYNSWWSMVSTIRTELVPQLEALRNFVGDE